MYKDFDLKKWLAEAAATGDIGKKELIDYVDSTSKSGELPEYMRGITVTGINMLLKHYTEKELHQLTLVIEATATNVYLLENHIDPTTHPLEALEPFIWLANNQKRISNYVQTIMALMVGLTIHEELTHGGPELDINVPDL